MDIWSAMNANKMTRPLSNYSNALRWILSQNIDILTLGIDRQSATQLCQSYDQIDFDSNHVPRLGLEFEPAMERTDLCFFGGAELLLGNKLLSTGEWGPKLVRLRSSNIAKYVLPFYFIEYDRTDLGYILAGAFCKLNCSRLGRVESCSLIEALIQEISPQKTGANTIGKEFIDALCLIQSPLQLGFMEGRGSIIKIMGEASNDSNMVGSTLGRLIDLLGFSSYLDPIAIANVVSHSRSRGAAFFASLDYDFSQNKILPRVSIEILPNSWNRQRTLPANWKEIKGMLNPFGLSSNQIDMAESYCTLLPHPRVEPQKDKTKGAISNIDNHNFNTDYRANPSNLKISIGQNSSQIKGYCTIDPGHAQETMTPRIQGLG